MGSKPGGVATRTCIPHMAPPSSSEWATLLPSRTYAKVRPASRSLCSLTVRRSATHWQGCSKSDRACTMGTVTERAEHDRIDVARQHAAGVFDGLAPAQLELRRGKRHRMCAELGDADLEGHPGAGGRLLEDHGDGHAREPSRIVGRGDLHLGREIEEFGQLV